MSNRLHTHAKIRHIITGTAKRPRLAVFRSLEHIHAQIIDDTTGRTLAAASSLKLKGSLSQKSQETAKALWATAHEKKITEVVFDRGGFRYQGVIKLFGETLRQEGMKI